jgi:DNA polymerase III sliding clamp (beta) subunit (PCNA family)
MADLISFNRTDLRRALIACSSEPARLSISQLLIEPGGTVVATDGHRLHILEGMDVGDPEKPVTVPRRLLDAALHMHDPDTPRQIQISVEEGSITIHCFVPGEPKIALTQRRSTAHQFAPYRNVTGAIKSPKGSWVTTVTKARKALRETTVLENNDACGMTSDGPMLGEAAQVFANRSYLQDTLRGLAKGDEVTFEWSRPLEPITVKAPGIFAVIMPVRPQ